MVVELITNNILDILGTLLKYAVIKRFDLIGYLNDFFYYSRIDKDNKQKM